MSAHKNTHTQSGVRVCVWALMLTTHSHWRHCAELSCELSSLLRFRKQDTNNNHRKKKRRRQQSFALGSGHFAWLRWPGQVSRLAAANASKTHTRQKRGERKYSKNATLEPGATFIRNCWVQLKVIWQFENRAETKLKPSSVGCEAKWN